MRVRSDGYSPETLILFTVVGWGRSGEYGVLVLCCLVVMATQREGERGGGE